MEMETNEDLRFKKGGRPSRKYEVFKVGVTLPLSYRNSLAKLKRQLAKVADAETVRYCLDKELERRGLLGE